MAICLEFTLWLVSDQRPTRKAKSVETYEGIFHLSMKESEFKVSHSFTPSAAFLWPRSISLMLPYCDKGGGDSHMFIKEEVCRGLSPAPDACKAEQMVRCTQLKLEQL